MSKRYVILDNSKPHFLTLTLVGWANLFDQEKFRNIILDALRYAQKKKGLILNAYVVMPSHVHLIAKSERDFRLWETMRDLKKFTSKTIVKKLLESEIPEEKWFLDIFRIAALNLKNYDHFKVWQDGYHGIDVSTERVLYQKLDYIHNNPVKAKLAIRPEEYEFSSARNYIGRSSVLEVSSI